MQDREASLIRAILVTSLLVSEILVLVLAFRSVEWALVLAAFIVVSAIFWLLIPYICRKKIPISWVLVIAVLNLCLFVPELALRVAGFRYESGMTVFGIARPQEFVRFDHDEKLFWKLPSSLPNVNSLGFPGGEIVVPKPKDVYRMLFLGDSVTQQGYPDLVEHSLSTKYPGSPRTFESITLAVSGYSSHQGRVLAETYGSKFDPDLVFVYFGWNDHWQAHGPSDSERVMRRSTATWFKVVDYAYNYSRLLQSSNRLWNRSNTKST